MTLNLQVSTGEAIDKLTILDIKLNKIKSKKLDEVEREHSYLTVILEEVIDRNRFYCNLLRDINLKIWDEQDIIREKLGKETSEQLNKRFLDVYHWNDSRFLIKNKINQKENSQFKEQKGYKVRRAIIEVNNDDKLLLVGAVRYLSIHYDSVIILSLDREVWDYYQDDSSITVTELYPELDDIDIFIPGAVRISHNLLKYNTISNDNIYTRIGLDFSLAESHFYLPTP